MKKIGLSILFLSFFVIVGLGTILVLHYPQKKTAQKLTSNVRDNKPNSILIPDTNDAILGTRTGASLRTYNSPDGGYSITYPSMWTPSTQEQLKNFEGDVMVFTTGPIGEKILGYPSFLQIAVQENSQGLSLNNFITKHYGTVHLLPITINGVQGEETSDIPAPVSNKTIWVKPETKIYQIRFFDGVQPKISKDSLTKALASFTIH
jgi:hypothetical protein